MNQQNEQLAEFGKKMAKIGSFRIQLLFITLALLAGVPLQIVVAWRGTEPGPMEVLLRALLVLVSLSVAMAVFFWLILRTKIDSDT